MQETQSPSCHCCGHKKVHKWVCESCSLNQKLEEVQSSQIKDTINLEWSTNKKNTPATFYANRSQEGEETSPGSFGEYLRSKREQKQKSKNKMSRIQKEHISQQVHYMFCKFHDEPLSFYNKDTKDILCSICLFQNGALSKSSKNKGQCILPLKSSIDLIRVQLKEMMTSLSQVSNKLDENIKKCRRSQESIKEHEVRVNNQIEEISAIMIQQIKLKQKQAKIGIKYLLGNLLQEYEDKQSNYRQIAGNTKQLKFLASKSRELKSDELAYLFQSAKEVRLRIKNSNINIAIFDPVQYSLHRFDRRQFNKQIGQIFDFLNGKELKPKKYSPHMKTKQTKQIILKHRDKSYTTFHK